MRMTEPTLRPPAASVAIDMLVPIIAMERLPMLPESRCGSSRCSNSAAGGAATRPVASSRRARAHEGRRPRSRSAFPTTEAELRLIARAAIMGDSSQPVKG